MSKFCGPIEVGAKLRNYDMEELIDKFRNITQLVEYLTDIQEVDGSNPSVPTTKWVDGRVDDGTRLLIWRGVSPNLGSNPNLPAKNIY